MRDRRAEGGVGRPLRVDVDPLVVAGEVGEGIDLRLVDDVPLGGAELDADEVEAVVYGGTGR